MKGYEQPCRLASRYLGITPLFSLTYGLLRLYRFQVHFIVQVTLLASFPSC